MKRPLSRFDFLERRFLGLGGLSEPSVASLASDFSGMLVTLADAFFFASLVGDDDRDDDEIHDFLLKFESDLTGVMGLGESACLIFSFPASVRVRSGLGSLEGSRLLLEKGKNLDDRRELLCLNCGICKCSSGASSELGLEPPEDE